MRTALALRLYAADHDGRHPPNLGALVPRYLSAVPADLLAAGSPLLKYVPDNEPRVYSVGKDSIDDGGVEAVEDATTGRLTVNGVTTSNKEAGDLILKLTARKRPPEPNPQDTNTATEDAR